MKTNKEQQKFNSNPAAFIEKAIRDYIANNPNNRFLTFREDAIWDNPVIGFASGDDPLFQDYKTIIGDFHVTPREVLEMYIDFTARGDKTKLTHVSVISFALPATLKTRESNRGKIKSVLSVGTTPVLKARRPSPAFPGIW